MLHVEIERQRVARANRRARKFGRAATLTLDEWLHLLDQYNYSCAYCFGQFESLDHVTDLCNGGSTSSDNVVPCCVVCNQKKNEAMVTKKPVWFPSLASAFWPRVAEAVYA